jgi:pseudouridine-5'-phosphate glycosidase
MSVPLDIAQEVQAALQQGRPVVALESTIISHGLPWPDNLQAARQAEAVIRSSGATPATIALLAGRAVVGLTDADLQRLATSRDIRKASRRDLAVAIAQGADASTTVAATMLLAYRAGIRVFATGGIGGVHPVESGEPLDVSADLLELARTPVAVVCAGAKSILDLPATLEVLETHGVPVLGYATDTFPAFYLHSSGLPVSARVDSPQEAARVLAAHWALGGGGVVLANPLPPAEALDPLEYHPVLQAAQAQARKQGVQGAALTPFLLARLAEGTNGQTLRANLALLVANARLAAAVAVALAEVS